MKNDPNTVQEYREQYFPSSELAEKWVGLLKGIVAKTTPEERNREFLFVHGWLRGLADADLLNAADLPEVREIAIKAMKGNLENYAQMSIDNVVPR